MAQLALSKREYLSGMLNSEFSVVHPTRFEQDDSQTDVRPACCNHRFAEPVC